MFYFLFWCVFFFLFFFNYFLFLFLFLFISMRCYRRSHRGAGVFLPLIWFCGRRTLTNPLRLYRILCRSLFRWRRPNKQRYCYNTPPSSPTQPSSTHKQLPNPNLSSFIFFRMTWSQLLRLRTTLLSDFFFLNELSLILITLIFTIIIIIIIIIIVSQLASFSHQHQLVVFHISLSDSKSLHRPRFCKSSSLFGKPLGFVPSAPVTIGITALFTFLSFFLNYRATSDLSLFSFTFIFTL